MKKIAAEALVSGYDKERRDFVAYLTKQLDFVNKRYFADKPNNVLVDLGIPDVIRYNGGSATPAAELRPRENRIVVNMALPKLRCPMYVYRYLLHHERSHQVFPPDGKSVHTEAFRAHELKAPNRRKAIEWLKRNCFPVMD
jgi:hypothetical protein